MIPGLSSFTYGWNIGFRGFNPPSPLDENDLLDRTMQMGLGCLQLGDNLPVHSLTQKRRSILRQKAADNNIRLELGAKGMSPAHLVRYIELATYFSSPLLRFVIDSEDYAPATDVILGVLKEVKPVLEEKNIVLGIENHDRFRSSELAALMEKVNSSHIGICLDCANSIGAGEGLEHVAGYLAPYTVNLHIKDFNITRVPHKMGFIVEGAPLGKGLLDLDFLMSALSRYNRCRSAIFEQWVPPERDPADTVMKEKIWAGQGITHLKTLPYFHS